MDVSRYTERTDWETYWKNQEIIPYEKLYIDEYTFGLPKSGNLIEIGGFPGKFAGYFRKYFNLEVTILDYVMIPDIVHDVERSYGIPQGSIHTIIGDFFEFSSDDKYNIVLSVGFIEHFEDTELVIRKHIDLLSASGHLLITLPNFRGINGLVQKYFDPKNYKIHNIRSMELRRLKRILSGMELKEFRVEYHGKPNIWLEANAPVGRKTRKMLLFFGKIIKRIPLKKNWLLAPHIVITGKK